MSEAASRQKTASCRCHDRDTGRQRPEERTGLMLDVSGQDDDVGLGEPGARTPDNDPIDAGPWPRITWR